MLKILFLYSVCAFFVESVPAQGDIDYTQNCKIKYNTPSVCAPVYQARCLCGCAIYEGKWQFIVNCTDIGFKNTSILQHLPAQTEVLIFTGNFIEELPWNVFGTQLRNLTSLRVVDMSNNGLQEIRGKSYHNVANVELLILNHNSLSISSGLGQLQHHHPRVFSNFVNLKALHLTDAFADDTPETLAEDLHDIFVQSNLTKLIKLHLEQNEIEGFKDSRIFCDLPNLMDIYLGDNHLKHLDFNIECLPHLRFIDLERNHITSLNSTDLNILDSFPARNRSLEIDLSGNPFSCDCEIIDLFQWLQQTNVKVRRKTDLQCKGGSPETNDGEYLLNLRQIQCAPKQMISSSSNAQHRSIPILIGFLVSLIFVLVGLLVYMNRTQLKQQLTPILDNVSRKVHYTSIGKQEEQEMDV